ncbi:alpha/beta fold hydrolase [Catellatospora sichuanensis]|uniref:alpha/beta fold hydrolase n=1 Tax=Catellatospora sichuanensis TaxID=1969805 RepID=UPI0011826BFC|nr:alpha/beta hydrolase [Catellatospora sichuanensis]
MTRRIWRVALAALLLFAAVLIGLLASLLLLTMTASLTGSRGLALLAAGLGLALTTWILGRFATRLLAGHGLRRWLPIAVSGATVVVAAIVVGGLLFAPSPSYLPSTATTDTRYWDLHTGSRIAYTHTPAAGLARPTPVILIHGGPGAPPGRPSPLAPAMAAAGFDVYEYHQVGAGLSSRLPDVADYTVARHVADLDAIVAGIGTNQVVLIGGSWGSQLIANYLAAHPDRVARAVVTSPGTIWSPAFAGNEHLSLGGRQDQQAVLARHTRFAAAQVLLAAADPRAAHTLLPDSVMDGVYQAFVSELDMNPGCPDSPDATTTEAPPAGFGFWVNAMTTRDARQIADPRPALRAVTTPMLILRGECDYLAWEVAREYRDLLPNAVLLPIDGGGHDISADRPDQYRAAVTAFLRDQPLPAVPYLPDAPPW